MSCDEPVAVQVYVPPEVGYTPGPADSGDAAPGSCGSRRVIGRRVDRQRTGTLHAHKEAGMREYVASTNGRLPLHFLPGNAPDLDLDEVVGHHVGRAGGARCL